MDRASKGLMDFLDKHEGRTEGSSFNAINKERVRQGYKAHKNPSAKSEALKKKKEGKEEGKYSSFKLKPCPECGSTSVHTHQ